MNGKITLLQITLYSTVILMNKFAHKDILIIQVEEIENFPSL